MLARTHQIEPGKVNRLVEPDLDWIVMKAIEKDRTRRYETANGLAMDLQRHLSNEPVVARPPSNLYRFQKLVRRNKFIVAAVGAVAAALIVGLGVSTSLDRARRQTRMHETSASSPRSRSGSSSGWGSSCRRTRPRPNCGSDSR